MTTKTIATTLAAGLAALSIGSAAMTAPAAAGGQISVHVAPGNAQQAQAMQAGLGIYSLYNGLKGGANIRQLGNGNAAGIGQNGWGNNGVIHQKGKGHNATLQQNGNANNYGIFQFGKNTNANVAQNGNGQTGATFQFGW